MFINSVNNDERANQEILKQIANKREEIRFYHNQLNRVQGTYNLLPDAEKLTDLE
jgi:hypothetical protein